MQKVFIFLIVLMATACGDEPKGTQQVNRGSEFTILPDSSAPKQPLEQSEPDQRDEATDKKPDVTVNPAPVEPSYWLDDRLRLNEIQMKGTHNSYHLASDHPSMQSYSWVQYSLPPLREQLEDHDVRQFELDIHYIDGRFLIYHNRDFDERSTCRMFIKCMSEIVAWSNENPGHHPVIVFLELKDRRDHEKMADHMEELEAVVRRTVPRNQLLTPDDVRRDYAGLQEAVEKHGWPTLRESRGKIMVVILDEGAGAYRYTYNGASLKGRAMFVTLSGWPFGVVMAINSPIEQMQFIQESVAKGKLVLTRVDGRPGKGTNYEGNLEAALAAGSHMIATDYPVDDTIEGYAVRMPGGTPSRCNPVTAQPECTSLLIENPELLQKAP